jgi:hypothetical protein
MNVLCSEAAMTAHWSRLSLTTQLSLAISVDPVAGHCAEVMSVCNVYTAWLTSSPLIDRVGSLAYLYVDLSVVYMD